MSYIKLCTQQAQSKIRCESRKTARLTYASTVKHQVPSFAIAEAPKNISSTEGDNSCQDVVQPFWAFRYDSIVRGCFPQVRIGYWLLPQSQRVRNPIREQSACFESAQDRFNARMNKNGAPSKKLVTQTTKQALMPIVVQKA